MQAVTTVFFFFFFVLHRETATMLFDGCQDTEASEPLSCVKRRNDGNERPNVEDLESFHKEEEDEETSMASPSSSSSLCLHVRGRGTATFPQSVMVAVNIRPLTATELKQGCKHSLRVVPGVPQVELGSHSFTFDHVYGSSGNSSSNFFDECVAPLVEGLFQGYNATVLAYGQTGSGKTYTMGTGAHCGDFPDGIIPCVMHMLFRKFEETKNAKDKIQLRVSYIEIRKEEVHDLLDPNPLLTNKAEAHHGSAWMKAPIQIRENINGEITLAGVAEIDVHNLQEMSLCLKQGSLCRATGSTNINASSSRSHAIFTITLESSLSADDQEFSCSKIHLVDLAGSERAKRSGTDGPRFKEGVHINRGLLALGNVISALGDKRKRKERGHIPYRDSKLTRLLQDSLGGNSRTVMIACVSPADSNAEETLNTLKYASRARNIQNKPIVNRDPLVAETQKMQQQLELLEAELLCARTSGASSHDTQRMEWLEVSNTELRKQLEKSSDACNKMSQGILEAQAERDKLQLKLQSLSNWKDHSEMNEEDGIKESYLQRIHYLEAKLQKQQAASPRLDLSRSSSRNLCSSSPNNIFSMATHGESKSPVFGDLESEKIAKEWEHALAQNYLGKELKELTQCLEQKETEIASFMNSEALALKHHFEEKFAELEEEKSNLQKERDKLMAELGSLVSRSDEQAQKTRESYLQKLKILETQIAALKKKQVDQTHLLRQKMRSEETAKHLQDEVHRMKAHKVQLVQRMKQEADNFRMWKASQEKEIHQLRKEGRKNEIELQKLQNINQRQKLVLQRKTEAAATFARRLKEILEARKSSHQSSRGNKFTNYTLIKENEQALQQWLDHELDVVNQINEVRSSYQMQSEMRATIAKELEALKQEETPLNSQMIPLHLNEMTKFSANQIPSFSPAARQARIQFLEKMISISSKTLVDMASQLSDAEEHEKSLLGNSRWSHLRTLADARNLLQLTFNAAASARYQVYEKDNENMVLKSKMNELTDLLVKMDDPKSINFQGHLRKQSVAMVLGSPSGGREHKIEDVSFQFSHIEHSSMNMVQCTEDCSSSSSQVHSVSYSIHKVISGMSTLSARQEGVKGKTSEKQERQHRWPLLHFKWWKMPWKLST